MLQAVSVQQALRRLSILLRQRGTSPELGKALRRAVRELDGVLMGKTDSERQTALRSATTELRACLRLIDESSRPADLEQREGTAEALALLVPLESPEDAPPAAVELPPQPAPTRRAVAPTLLLPELARPEPLPPQAAPPPAPPPAQPAPPPAAARPAPELPAPPPKRHVRAPLERPKLDRPKKTKAVISGLLSKLTSLYSRRRGLLDEPLSVYRDFETIDEQVDAVMTSVGWITDDVAGWVEARFGAAEDPPEHFASAMAMLRSGAAGPVLRFFRNGTFLADPSADGVLAALRMCPGDSWLPELKAAFFALGGRPHAGILAVLADRGEVSRDYLLNALDDEEDAAAISAAELLAWLGRPPEDRQALESRGLRDAPVSRRLALLFAAVALGSGRALSEIQTMLDSGAPVTARAIDALAVAGGPRDGHRLLDLAARQPDLAERAVLAAGHLGDPGCAGAISKAAVADDVKSRALRAILGHGPPATDPKNPGRRLYGEPWTAVGAVARLTAPDELLQTRSWHAWEIGVRFGLTPPAFLDAGAPSNHQRIATERMRAAVDGARWTKAMTTASGKWLFFGQPIG